MLSAFSSIKQHWTDGWRDISRQKQAGVCFAESNGRPTNHSMHYNVNNKKELLPSFATIQDEQHQIGGAGEGVKERNTIRLRWGFW